MKIESQVSYLMKEFQKTAFGIQIQRRNWKRKFNMNPISSKSVRDRGEGFPLHSGRLSRNSLDSSSTLILKFAILSYLRAPACI